MTSDRRNLSDEEIGKLLRLGDPASDGSEPAREEVAAMRRTVLNAVDTRASSRPWPSRSLATAMATVAVALIALAILLQAGPWNEVPQPEAGPATSTEPAPEIATPSTPTDPVAAAEEIPEAPVTEPSPDPANAAEVPEATVAALPAAAGEPTALAAVEESPDVLPPTAARKPRTVQFTAPGGTRIIWTLDPDFELPVGEPDDQARGEL